MTLNKDQKRLIRTRMRKTGESYTRVRAALIARRNRQERGYAAPRERWPMLAGMSDEKVRASTGRTWAEWVAELDRAAAHQWSHRDIARHVHMTYPKVNPWWTQAVAVGYERIRGLREIHQRRDGCHEANKSRTFPVDVSTIYDMFRDARRRATWLTAGIVRVRTAIADKSLRADWQDGTQVNVYFVARGPGKTTVAVQHAKLTSQADVQRVKSFWDARLDALRQALG